MKRLLIAAALLLSMLMAALPAHAAGSETFHFKIKGQFAEAYFFSSDPAGCVETFVYVAAEDDVIKHAGHPTAVSDAFIFIDQYDYCTGTALISAEGFATLPDTAFQIDRKITAATLTATIEVFDFVSGNSFPVDISVTWTGSGDTFRERLHDQIKTPDFKLNRTFDGTARNATASGSVVLGGTNLTPDSAGFADLQSVRVGEVDIVH